MDPTPDSPQERDDKADALVAGAKSRAATLAVESGKKHKRHTARDKDLYSQVCWLRREVRVLYIISTGLSVAAVYLASH